MTGMATGKSRKYNQLPSFSLLKFNGAFTPRRIGPRSETRRRNLWRVATDQATLPSHRLVAGGSQHVSCNVLTCLVELERSKRRR